MHKHTLAPEFEEEFIFELTPSQLASAVLDVRVMHSEGGGGVREEALGQVLLHLDNINLTEPVVLWKGLSLCDKKQEVGSTQSELLLTLESFSETGNARWQKVG